MKKVLVTLAILSVSVSLFAFTAFEMEGKWFLALKTPIGIKKGNLVCEFSDENEFDGTLNIFGKDNEVQDGKLIGDKFTFVGDIQFWGKIPYTAEGVILDSGFVKVVVKSEKGRFLAVAYKDEEKLKDAKHALKLLEKEFK